MFPILLRRLYRIVGELGWGPFLILSLCHAAVTWVGFRLSGEAHLTEAVNFLYFYATTAATIGYGDLSPQGPAGRIFAALWLFPGSLIFFTVFITKVTSTAAQTWKKRMNGLADLSHLENAIVIVGYSPIRTKRMIEEIRAGADGKRPLILVSDREVNVDRDQIHLVRTESLSSRLDLIRAAVPKAFTVIVYADSDDQTLSAALAVAALNPTVRIVAHFSEEDRAELLRAHTNAVCIVSQVVEIMVREVQDPGASLVLLDLASAQTSVAVFSLACSAANAKLGEIEARLRSHGATVIGLRDNKTGQILYGASRDTPAGGTTIFYIGNERLPENVLHFLERKSA